MKQLGDLLDATMKPEEFIVLRKKYKDDIKNGLMDIEQADTMLFFYKTTVLASVN